MLVCSFLVAPVVSFIRNLSFTSSVYSGLVSPSKALFSLSLRSARLQSHIPSLSVGIELPVRREHLLQRSLHATQASMSKLSTRKSMTRGSWILAFIAKLPTKKRWPVTRSNHFHARTDGSTVVTIVPVKRLQELRSSAVACKTKTRVSSHERRRLVVLSIARLCSVATWCQIQQLARDYFSSNVRYAPTAVLATVFVSCGVVNAAFAHVYRNNLCRNLWST